MKRFIFLLSSFVLMGVFLSACEDEFPGKREKDIQILNAPYRMHFINLAGTDYLAVASTNFLAEKETGNLNFYDLADPRTPSLNQALSLELPSNVSDFYIEDTMQGTRQRLYVLDRNEDQLLFYNFDGTSFSAVPDEEGVAKYRDTFSNPQAVTQFEYNSKDYLAIAVESAPSIQFFDLNTEEMLDLNELLDLFPGLSEVKYRVDREQRVGARLRMVPRIERQESGLLLLDNAIRGISSSQADGVGIAALSVIPGTSIILGANYLDTAAFGFRFSDFENISNLLLNLPDAENGYSEDSEKYPGTKETGFRGMALDEAGHAFFSSRSDNAIYWVPTDLFQQELQNAEGKSDRNTYALLKNNTDHSNVVVKIDPGFDSDKTDSLFPRLGELSVSTDGSKIWVLGYKGSKRGFDRGRLFSVSLANPDNGSGANIEGEYEFGEGQFPQKLLYDEASNTLYASDVNDNRIWIFDVSGSAAQALGYVSTDGSYQAL